MLFSFYIAFVLQFLHLNFCVNVKDNKVEKCNLPQTVKDEIASYAEVVNQIVNSSLYGEYKGTTYKHLEDFIDKFGNRIAGSANLENAIDYVLDKSKTFNLENVHGEKVEVPRWIRGKESATLLKPRHQPLAMLGLGGSVGTGGSSLIGEVVVVSSFEELTNISSQVKGKIVVFNQQYIGYSETVKYRNNGASAAAKHGAIAALITSITPFSLNTPHTGWQSYENGIRKIPAACITKEDANMLHRMFKKGTRLVIEIRMEAETVSPGVSRNTVAEIRGGNDPDKVVVISGHLDSWDVGQGAMDDGAGAFLSWNSLAVLKGLGLRARRTIRTILWTAEEEGLIGALAYVKAHKNESDDLNFVMEADEGTFEPLGIKYTGSSTAGCILQEVLNLLVSINTTQLTKPADGGPDITMWLAQGIPGASLLNKAEKYFWYHHSAADTLDVENPDILDKCTALWASVAYVIADLSFDMPREN